MTSPSNSPKVPRGKTPAPKGLSYRRALELINQGKQVARHGWVTEWLEKKDGRVLLFDDGNPMPWLPGEEETEANDWEVR
jgi:hypothetical protein